MTNMRAILYIYLTIQLKSMSSITKRDIKFFFIGLITMFLIEVIFDWEGAIKSFKQGFNEGYYVTRK